jgi:hypothetical protein
MTATYEQIIEEAHRRQNRAVECEPFSRYVFEVTREGWTPPPVDPDVLAYREWLNGPFRVVPTLEAAYLAGAHMARQQEQERAKVLVEYASVRAHLSTAADAALAAYRAGRAAR